VLGQVVGVHEHGFHARSLAVAQPEFQQGHAVSGTRHLRVVDVMERKRVPSPAARIIARYRLISTITARKTAEMLHFPIADDQAYAADIATAPNRQRPSKVTFRRVHFCASVNAIYRTRP